MAFETEIKIALGRKYNRSEILEKCMKKFGASTTVNQLDEYFDTKNQLLKINDFTVRLRQINDELLLAIKGPRMYLDDKIHKRIELEFRVYNRQDIDKQIKSHSLNATTVIEKTRWSFESGDVQISVDRLPFIGSFIEIQGSYENIKRVVSELELTEDDAVAQNYTELLEDYFSKHGIPGRPNLRATFDSEKKWIEYQKK